MQHHYFTVLFVFFSCLYGSALHGQEQAVLEVTVVNSRDKSPVTYAMIVAYDTTGQSPIVFEQGTEQGGASLPLPKVGPWRLEVNALGYKPYKKVLGFIRERTIVTVNLEQTAQELTEIVVRDTLLPISYRPDTVTYNARAFYSGNERKLKDLVDRMPGLEVDENLTVTYRGEEIKTLLVEGKPFFGGDSELALRGLPADAVGRIQVLEDYKPLGFSLDPYGRKKIALNILIKEEKKNVYFGEGEILGGVPANYFGRLDAFRFNKRTNLYITAGANNVREELLSLQSTFRLLGGNSITNDQLEEQWAVEEILQPTYEPSKINQQLVAVGGNHDLSKRTQINIFALLPRTATTQELTRRTMITTVTNDSFREELNQDNRQQQTTLVSRVNFKTIDPSGDFLTGTFKHNQNFINENNKSNYRSDFTDGVTRWDADNVARQTKVELAYGFGSEKIKRWLAWVYAANERGKDSLRLKASDPLLINIGDERNIGAIGQYIQTNSEVVGTGLQYRYRINNYWEVTAKTEGEINRHRREVTSDQIESNNYAEQNNLSNKSGINIKYGQGETKIGLGLQHYYSRWNVTSTSKRQRNFVLPELYLNTRLSPSTKISFRIKDKVNVPSVLNLFDQRYITDPYVKRSGNPTLVPNRARSFSTSLKYSNPIKRIVFRVYANINQQRGPQTVSVFSLVGPTRSIRPVMIDQTTNAGAVTAEVRHSGRRTETLLETRLDRRQELVVSDEITVPTVVSTQKISARLKSRINKRLNTNTRISAVRSVFNGNARFSTYRVSAIGNVNWDDGPFHLVLSSNFNGFDLTGDRALRFNGKMDILYTLKQKPIALRLLAGGPLGSAEYISFEQTELIFREDKEVTLNPYLIVGISYQF